MYYNVMFSVKMSNKFTAAKALEIAKREIAKCAISEEYFGQHTDLANSLIVCEKSLISNDGVGFRYESFEVILTDILKVIAKEGITFEGDARWDSTYDWETFEFSSNGSELSITSNFHSVDEEPTCDDCESGFNYDEDEECYVCDCGKKMSVEEYLSKCEFISTEIYKF